MEKKRTYYKTIKIAKKPKIWTEEEDKILIINPKEYNNKNWSKIALFIKDRTLFNVQQDLKEFNQE